MLIAIWAFLIHILDKRKYPLYVVWQFIEGENKLQWIKKTMKSQITSGEVPSDHIGQDGVEGKRDWEEVANRERAIVNGATWPVMAPKDDAMRRLLSCATK